MSPPRPVQSSRVTPLPAIENLDVSTDAPTPKRVGGRERNLGFARRGRRAADEARRGVQRQPGRQRPAAGAERERRRRATGTAGGDGESERLVDEADRRRALVMAAGRAVVVAG